MRFHLSLVPVLFVAALPAVAYGQNTAAPASGGAETILRSETRVVLVDAAVIDRKNRFARDLTQKDFHIREDGKEQKITSFSLESAGVSPERSTKHYIVLYFDTATLTPATLLTVRQDAIRFVDAFASSDRNIAVIGFGDTMQVLQNFTADPARVKDALNKLQNFTAAGAGAAAPAGRGRGGANAPTPDASGYRRMLASLRTVADSVSTIRGRKALVLFSGGLNTAADINSDLAATIDSCNKANVAVYGVVGHGLVGELNIPHSFGRALQRVATSLVEVIDSGSAGGDTIFGFQRGGRGGAAGPVDASGAPMNASSSLGSANQDVMRALATGTGGQMLGTSNNLPDELGRIAQEQDEYYLIGYTPAIDSAEGTCHTLQVKVDRSGVDVRARKGYCTSKPVALVTEKPAGTDLEKRAASGVAGNIALRMQLPWFYSAPNVARVNLVMDIVPAAVQFVKVQGKLHGEFDLLGIANKPDGSVGARVSDTVKLDFDNQQQADAFLKTPYHYSNEFEIVPGQYDFRIAVSSGERGFGKAEMPLTIEPWNGQVLAMSGLALSHDTHPAPEHGGLLEEILPGRDRPLVASGMELVPTGLHQFRAGEQVSFYFEVYEPPLRQRDLAVRIRVLDRGTGRQISDSGMLKAEPFIRPGDSVIPIVMKLPIVSAGLPAGAYKLEVSVAGAAGENSVVRTADFDVN
jgi:VWFA-related protein